MTTLKQSQDYKPKKAVTPLVNADKRSIKKDDDLIDLFPLPRYFQIHFEHVHDNARDMQGKIDLLTQTLAKVEAKLDRFITLLGQHSEPEH